MQSEADKLKKQVADRVRLYWVHRLDERQQRLVTNSRLYANSDPAGIPGHQLMLIIDKMAAMLDEHELPVKGPDK